MRGDGGRWNIHVFPRAAIQPHHERQRVDRRRDLDRPLDAAPNREHVFRIWPTGQRTHMGRTGGVHRAQGESGVDGGRRIIIVHIPFEYVL